LFIGGNLVEAAAVVDTEVSEPELVEATVVLGLGLAADMVV
jgi:hypothetical protein